VRVDFKGSLFRKPNLSSKWQIPCRFLHRTPLRFRLGYRGTPLLVGVSSIQLSQDSPNPAATVGVQFATTLNKQPFPTVQDLDNEFDGWHTDLPLHRTRDADRPANITANYFFSQPNSGWNTIIPVLLTRLSHIRDSRFWLEYHHSNYCHKTLSYPRPPILAGIPSFQLSYKTLPA
jgi:hypothetical protein